MRWEVKDTISAIAAVFSAIAAGASWFSVLMNTRKNRADNSATLHAHLLEAEIASSWTTIARRASLPELTMSPTFKVVNLGPKAATKVRCKFVLISDLRPFTTLTGMPEGREGSKGNEFSLSVTYDGNLFESRWQYAAMERLALPLPTSDEAELIPYIEPLDSNTVTIPMTIVNSLVLHALHEHVFRHDPAGFPNAPPINWDTQRPRLLFDLQWTDLNGDQKSAKRMEFYFEVSTLILDGQRDLKHQRIDLGNVAVPMPWQKLSVSGRLVQTI